MRQSMDERFDTFNLRMDQFEDRVHADIAGMRHDITLLSVRVEGVEQQVKSLTLRTGKVEDGLLTLNGRIDNLAEATRQRFRALN